MSKTDAIKARLVVAKAKDKKKTTKKDRENKENRATNARKVSVKKEKKKPASTRSLPAVKWSKDEYFYLTDELLTIIEGKPRYRQAFGFEKGTTENVDTGGKKLGAICVDVAEDLFITGKPDTTYTTEDLATLGGVIRNRVGTLKKKYAEHHTNLGATGHGLAAAGKAGEMTEDSDIANAWDVILAQFPWYLRMDALLGSSPVINRSAVAHSGTRVDLGVLDRDGEAHNGPIIDVDSDDGASSVISWPSSPAPRRRAAGRTDDDDEEDDDDAAVVVPATPAVKVKAEGIAAPLSSARGTKRKSMQDHIHDVTTQNNAQRLKLTQVKEREKTARTQAKYDAKSSVELAKLQHQQREADLQRQHEVQMMERQMQLEALRHNPPVPAMGMYGAGAPAYGAPPTFGIDPSLR